MRVLQLLAAVLLLGITASQAQEQRAFSLFSLVKFKKDECKATKNEKGGAYSGLIGTCMSSTECGAEKGMHKGNCANGFGVCCVKELKACGGTVTYNNTYIANKGYPTALAAGVHTCAYTIKRVSTGGPTQICQLRLDFNDFVLTAGTNGATASNTRMEAKGGSGHEPPVLSGTNTGDHMYVEVHSMDPTITFTTIASQTTNKWNVRVCQISCDSEWKAPIFCTQYFTAPNGIVRSYNARDATATKHQELVTQDINICIRQAKHHSGIFFTTSQFQVGGTIAKSVNDCSGKPGIIQISGEGGGTFCEAVLSPVKDQTKNAAITIKKGPFRIKHFHTSTATAAQGFIIHYNQF